MSTRIVFKRGTASDWTSQDPILAAGEVGVNLTDYTFKIGDGVTNWNSLSGSIIPEVAACISFDSSSNTPLLGKSEELTLVGINKSHRNLLGFTSPTESGVNIIQPHMAANGFYLVTPGTGAVMNVQGGPAVSVAGTMTHPLLDSADLITQTSRAQLMTPAPSRSVASIRTSFGRAWRGDNPTFGGFYYNARFSIVAGSAGTSVFVGMYGSTTAIPTNTVPTKLLNTMGFSYNPVDSNFTFISNDVVGPGIVIDLGSNFPKNTLGVMYDATMFVRPDIQDKVFFQLTDLGNKVTVTGSASVEIPASTTFLSQHMYINNTTSAGAVGMAIMRLYIETDY